MNATMFREHQVRLEGERIVLRPMGEGDWDLLYKWNNDPDVLYWFDGDDISARRLEEVQRVYRGMSQKAFMFIGEYKGRPIAECWLQEMNLDHLLGKYPGLDLRRIDLGIGEKELWGRGLGTEIIDLLTRFAFAKEAADMVFGPGIREDNARSRKAFAKNGYREVSKKACEPTAKSVYEIDMAIRREEWNARERNADDA